MDEDKSLIKVKNDSKGIRNIISNAVELFKSKVNKDYILSENSPEFLRRNKDLILKTIKIDFTYLDKVPDDILLEELRQETLPINGIIDTAFKRGYILKANPRRYT